MASVNLENVAKRFGSVVAVHPISLEIEDREFVVLVGPSGCGKSTTLRMIAGLETITEGTVRIGERVVNQLPPRARNISMVFQNYALYPHMSVAENQGFGLKIAGRPKAEISERVGKASETLSLTSLLDRRPAQLSGGQRQRVAMGRAIVRNPDVFLFDEPLSNLDAKLRAQMRTEIKKLHQRVQTTVIYVTHDQVEAMTLADRIVVMRDGRIEQVGTPYEIFHQPASTFVAGFIGNPPMNLLPAVVHRSADRSGVTIGTGVFIPLPDSVLAGATDGMPVTFGFRPEGLVPRQAADAGAIGHAHQMDLPIVLVEPLGSEALVFIDLGGEEVVAKLYRVSGDLPTGTVPMVLDLDQIHLFDAESGTRL